MSTPPGAPDTFAILAVCTGNVCRSPAMERWLRAAFGPDSGVRVTSAGVRAVVGAPISPPMVPFVAAGGGDPGGFAARQLTAQLIERADLVLVAARGHRRHVVGLVPAAVRRTFTLREFARLASLVEPDDLDRAAPVSAAPPARLAALVPLAVRRRGQVLVNDSDDDVLDPIGQSDAVYRRSAAQMLPAIETVARVVRGG